MPDAIITEILKHIIIYKKKHSIWWENSSEEISMLLGSRDIGWFRVGIPGKWLVETYHEIGIVNTALMLLKYIDDIFPAPKLKDSAIEKLVPEPCYNDIEPVALPASFNNGAIVELFAKIKEYFINGEEIRY